MALKNKERKEKNGQDKKGEEKTDVIMDENKIMHIADGFPSRC